MPALAPSSFHRGRPSIVTAPSERGVRWEMALSANCVPKPGVLKVPHLPSLKELGTRLLHPTYRHLGPLLGMAPRPAVPARSEALPSPPPPPQGPVGVGSRVALTEDPGAGASSRGTSSSSRRISSWPAGEAGFGAGGDRAPPYPAHAPRRLLGRRGGGGPSLPQVTLRGVRGSAVGRSRGAVPLTQ